MARPRTPTTAIQAYFDEFQLDEANASLVRGGKPVALAPTPFSLLCAFARRPAMLLTKEALLDEVWGHQFVTESVLKTAISDLRNALGDDARQPRFIETVPRRGYRFIAAIHAQAAQAATAPAPAVAPAAASASLRPMKPLPVVAELAVAGAAPGSGAAPACAASAWIAAMKR